MGLLLSTQLAAPQGLGRSAIYISTEASLNTSRLEQILLTHPVYAACALEARPSFNKVHAIVVNDLETQEHIIQYQLPVAVQKFNVGLVVIDSIAANFRAEHETHTGDALADRAVGLAKLGKALRKIAVEHNLAVVVTNQVSDRFDEPPRRAYHDQPRSSSPRVLSSSPAPQPAAIPQSRSEPRPRPEPLASQAPALSQPVTILRHALLSLSEDEDPMALDKQQQFFTGWGSDAQSLFDPKTPALGLTWTNQIDTRIVLKMEATSQTTDDYGGGHLWRDWKKRRFMQVVFAPWAPPTAEPVEYEITARGIVSLNHRHLGGLGDGSRDGDAGRTGEIDDVAKARKRKQQAIEDDDSGDGDGECELINPTQSTDFLAPRPPNEMLDPRL